MRLEHVQQAIGNTLRGMARAAGLVVLGAAAAGQGSSVRLNEIDVHKAGIDTLEFIELAGPGGASLAGHMLLMVDGDSVNAGVLDRAIDLNAYAIPASGLFVLGDTALVPKNLDLGPYDRIENGTTTFYLVTTTQPAALIGLVGSRIRVGLNQTSIPAYATIVDHVAIADADHPALDVVFDGAPLVGPDGYFLPAGITRCPNAPNGWSQTWSDYDSALPPSAPPTPGATNAPCDPGIGFCYGDGSGTACPCGNASPVGAREGCVHALGVGGKLHATGNASLANDTLVLTGTQLPDGPVMYFQGTNQLVNGAGAVFGDGLFCAGGVITRLGLKFSIGSTSSYPTAGDLSVSAQGLITVPGIRTYQGWFRSALNFCTPATFNLTHGLEIQWLP